MGRRPPSYPLGWCGTGTFLLPLAGRYLAAPASAGSLVDGVDAESFCKPENLKTRKIKILWKSKNQKIGKQLTSESMVAWKSDLSDVSVFFSDFHVVLQFFRFFRFQDFQTFQIFQMLPWGDIGGKDGEKGPRPLGATRGPLGASKEPLDNTRELLRTH